MRRVRIFFCLVGILLLFWGCEGGKEPTRPTFGFIKGKIYLNGIGPCCNLVQCDLEWNGCPDKNSLYCSVMNPYQGVKISVFFQRNLVEKTFTDENGNYYIRLPLGVYDIKVYPPQDHIETFMDVVILGNKETDLGEKYYIQKYVFQELAVEFYKHVTEKKIEEIMEETGNIIIQYYDNWVLVKVPEKFHVQEMIGILVGNYPEEINTASVNHIMCVD